MKLLRRLYSMWMFNRIFNRIFTPVPAPRYLEIGDVILVRCPVCTCDMAFRLNSFDENYKPFEVSRLYKGEYIIEGVTCSNCSNTVDATSISLCREVSK